ncbi:MAG: hypothetical protein V3S83_12605, partial [Gemmatimonadota bacterium]
EKRTPAQYYQRTAGQALEWRDMGWLPVIKQPVTDTTLNIESSVSETMDVFVRGLVRDTTASGTALEFHEVQETVTLGGAALPTANTYTEIIALQKPKKSLAEVIVTNNQTALKIARIPLWRTRAQYKRVQLHFIPVAGTVFEVIYFRKPDRIVSEDDPLDPAINEEAIMWRAAGNMHWMDNEDQAAERGWRQAASILKKIRVMEESFGEEDHSVQPWTGYLELENDSRQYFGDGSS